MADWPRSIKPEDRIKYLINARAEVLEMAIDGRLEVVKGVYSAYRGDKLIGEFDTFEEGTKAIRDDMVVERAVQQAWEDVAT